MKLRSHSAATHSSQRHPGRAGLAPLATATALLAALIPAQQASADTSTCVTSGSQVTCTFFHDPSGDHTQTWRVPPGVTSASFALYGADGHLAPLSGNGGIGARVTATLTEPVATATVLTSSASLAVTGQAVTYIATVTPTDNGGSVSFGDNDHFITGCTARPLNSNRQATCTVSYHASGTHNITANYTGDTNYGPSYSAAVTVVVYRPLTPRSTSCAGIYRGTGQNVTVPSRAHCTLLAGSTVSHDVTVGPGATFSCQGTRIGHDLTASSAAGIGLQSCQVGHDARLNGLTGDGPGGGASYLCRSRIGHDLTAQNSTATAAAVLIGDGPECTGSPLGNIIGHDLTVQNNAPPVDVVDNHIGHDLTVQNNTAGTNVTANTAGHDATCQNNTPPAIGAGNTAHGSNRGCPT